MILNNTWPQYLAVRLLILFMRDLGLLCIGYFFTVFALGGVVAIAHPVSIIIESLGAIEILFYLFFFLPYRFIIQTFRPYKPPPLTRAERAELFYKAAGLIPDVESFVRKWTNNAHLADIRIDNVKEWLLWALFEIEDMRSIDIDTHKELDSYIEYVQQVIGLELKPGRGAAEPLRLSFDPIYVEHRSLVYYLFIGGLDMMMSLWLLATGYKFYRRARSTFFTLFPVRPLTLLSPNVSDAPEMSYWYRPHRSKTHRPVIIVHGLGIGLPPYQFWMATIPKDVGIIAVEMLPISTRITSQVLPSTQELCDSIAAIAAQARREDRASWNDFVLVTSSYGTLLVKKLINHPDFGPRISGNILCDPVALLLHLPDVAYNFTRRTPTKARRGRPGRANEFEITWASATEAGTAYSLARRFCWRESALCREDIMPSAQDAERGTSRYGDQEDQSPSSTSMRTTVIQGGEDCIAPAKNVAAYVFDGGVTYNHIDIRAWKEYEWKGTEELELVFLDGKDHGQAMMVPRPSKKIRQVVEGYCTRALDPTVRPVSMTSMYGKGYLEK
ncbi:hypothetical protein KVR01_008016 [Diaporthe batatas]|uniref:uncharacterized protein n=1 Tax=Diaporthe batatas TaxID=748121 RepID=UPI001D049F4B|nr:uncharacterized protein KVR01_008016 [Diaporthe batatas]KAG8162251.1 hypothetical protein KVR01_008016 [Diaporthe batatas]